MVYGFEEGHYLGLWNQQVSHSQRSCCYIETWFLIYMCHFSVNCFWSDSITAFGGQYVIQTSALENAAGTCRVHLGDFNGDGETDILRSCDNKAYNALWFGSNSGFNVYGYVFQGSLLENTAKTCRLHIADL